MTISSKIPRAAAIVAFVISCLAVVSALVGQIFLLPLALIPLVAGMGILRRRVWSAYGYSLYLFAQLLFMPFVLVRSHGSMTSVPKTIASAVLTLALALLFLVAGRSLDVTGSQRGWASPWIALTVMFTVPLAFVQAFVIPNGSMEDTILRGDRLLVRCFPAPSVAREGIVVFRYPVDQRQTFVKRIVGIPGDRIKIREKVVYRNGAALKEPFTVHKTEYMDSYRDNFPSEPNSPFADAARDMLKNHVVNGEVVVPARSYFVLGDNRDSSLDSRYWGFVGASDLIGKPILIYGSEDQASESSPDGNRTVPRRIRWERILKVL